MQVGAMPWIANIKDLQYEAARRAIKTGVENFFACENITY